MGAFATIEPAAWTLHSIYHNSLLMGCIILLEQQTDYLNSDSNSQMISWHGLLGLIFKRQNEINIHVYNSLPNAAGCAVNG